MISVPNMVLSLYFPTQKVFNYFCRVKIGHLKRFACFFFFILRHVIINKEKRNKEREAFNMGSAVEKDNNNPYINHSSIQQQKKEAMKQISVSEKRQITIPKQFYDASGMGTEVVCELRGDEIILRALPQ